jgi:uncharacterized protein (DUF608 family)
MSIKDTLPRRQFLKQAASVVGAATQVGTLSGFAETRKAIQEPDTRGEGKSSAALNYPRVFQGRQLKMIAFPLGGVGAGSLALGGRGQLRDWEIFNKPSKGSSPPYAFPSIWVQSGRAKPIARVLEARILPPYEGQDGLGAKNSPGLSRLKTARFTGEYPLAEIDFEDRALPVQVKLEAFTPFIPHDPDDSGLPVGILRYRVTNPGSSPAKVSIAFSIDNPVIADPKPGAAPSGNKRVNEVRSSDLLTGLLMSNPGLPEDDLMQGSFALTAIPDKNTRVTQWRGWPEGPWWNSPLLFWDTFSEDGELRTEPNPHNSVGALCLQQSIAPGKSASFTFLLAWHFPNRTPDRCGWLAPPEKGNTVIGNFYATRFKNAWEVAEYTAKNMERLETRTRLFARTIRESTLPAAVKEGAMANLSTLASTTCFRTADGEFHGFEGSDDSLGCCYGNCTHVWNYETATPFLFPSLARSLRKASFGYSLDDQGAMRPRQVLPDGETRDLIAAADGQMGQIMHAYLDWKLSGDQEWLQALWPRVKKAIEFAWAPGGWDPDKSGVMQGVQNNTYDVAFFGPNPLCGIYYLGALRAGEEMAHIVGDDSAAKEYRKVFERGSQWIDSNLFNGEFFTQQIKGYPADKITPILLAGTDVKNTENPQYQMGKGCLIDQLVGQYLAHVMGLGDLISQSHLQTTLRSIYKYNYKRSLVDHDNTERTFALNDEAAMVICDYGTATRPRIPFPYFAEVMTGFEHSTAALMIYSGMVGEGVECIGNIRDRYDGEKRNPWDEAECGHHYARAMASWTSVVALSGFQYDGRMASVVAIPRAPHREFRCFWSTGTGWGTFSYASSQGQGALFTLKVCAGTLPCQSFEITGNGASASVRSGSQVYTHTMERHPDRAIIRLDKRAILREGGDLQIQFQA